MLSVNMDEATGVDWVRGTLRAVMKKRRISYAELVGRLAALGVRENERALRNKVVRGTFNAVFFVQCLEALGLDTLKLDMTAVMSKPEGEREFAREVPQKPTEKRMAEMEATIANIRQIVGEPE